MKKQMRLIGTNLTAAQSGRILFSALDFFLDSGNLLTVTGANGAGKSTLLRIIAGLDRAITGSIHIEEDGTMLPRAMFCHYLSDKNAMNPMLSVGENLFFWKKWSGMSNYDPYQALEILEIAHSIHIPYGILSTGQKRRVALARLLITWRPLWILDEPTSGLDDGAVDLFSIIMKRHMQSSGMIIAATHLPLGVGETSSITLKDD
ncbi:MAG: heme exporter protein A [Candidatus Tokpelaia sp. JSC188]|nr:MAG: heme exporter protein A [Candidatus Tokpelaia sp. JSC188]